MSTIAGEITSTGEAADQSTVERMIDAMPLANGGAPQLWKKHWVALGHRHSCKEMGDACDQQFAQDADLGLAVALTGSLFNRDELFEILARDFRMGSRSDAEFLLKAYARWGETFTEHLVGSFAFAIFDGNRDRVLLVRDQLGIKPLYYTHVSGKLRFASTLPGVLASGGVDTRVDPTGLHQYLTWHSIVPAPKTILQGVRKLPPATVMIVEANGEFSEHTYWRPDYRRDAERAGWSQEDWTDAIHGSLETAMERRFVDAPPVSVMLSGGLDSSMLVGIAAELSGTPVETFSIGFESVGESLGNEYRYSDRVAEYFGTQHHRIHIGASELAEAIPGAVSTMTEPMASHDVTAFYLLSRETAERASVVQSG